MGADLVCYRRDVNFGTYTAWTRILRSRKIPHPRSKVAPMTAGLAVKFP
jgi:hypothetical protein